MSKKKTKKKFTFVYITFLGDDLDVVIEHCSVEKIKKLIVEKSLHYKDYAIINGPVYKTFDSIIDLEGLS